MWIQKYFEHHKIDQRQQIINKFRIFQLINQYNTLLISLFFITMWTKKNNKNVQCDCVLFSGDNKLLESKRVKFLSKKIDDYMKPINKQLKDKKSLKKQILKTQSKQSLHKFKQIEAESYLTQSKQTQKLNHLTNTQPSARLSYKPQKQQIQKNYRDATRFPCVQPPQIIIRNTTIIKNIIEGSEYFSGINLRPPNDQQSKVKLIRGVDQNNVPRQSSLEDLRYLQDKYQNVKQRGGSQKQLIKNFKNKLIKEQIKQEKKLLVRPDQFEINMQRNSLKDLQRKSTVTSQVNYSDGQKSQVIQFLMKRPDRNLDNIDQQKHF